ncbi:Putative phage repressor (fragment) [Mesorhizobium plurifarium]|uniref:Putative phage repressor n=1 Tax=Mesorhizobium plurifarium TaxID=69974 RepID=A0A090EA87_MESPL
MTKQPRKPTAAAIELGKRIRQLRVEILEMESQQAFADLLGVTRGAVGNWELGQGIKFENVQLIALKTDCSLEWLTLNRGVPYPVRGIDHDISQLPQEDQDDLIPDIKAMVNRRLEKYKNR